MIESLKELFNKDRRAEIAFVLLIIITIWWVLLNPFDESVFRDIKYIWGSSYQIIALWGAVSGFFVSTYWGGYRSVLGRSILAFSFGLLFQVFGQTVYSYYNLFAQIEAPYPSLGDVGFFGSIPLYIYGSLLLAKASGVSVTLKAFDKKIQAFFIPFLALALSYGVFLNDYEFDFTQPLKIFLDFGYPLGQAIYVSVAILTLSLSRNILGGMLKRPILLFLSALIFQYICDYNFLYEANRGIWFVGGYGDYLYAISYFLMTTSILYIGATFSKIKNEA
jgi:hypothetical protein